MAFGLATSSKLTRGQQTSGSVPGAEMITFRTGLEVLEASLP